LKGEKDIDLHYSLINTLARNYIKSPKIIEPLIVQEIRKNPQYIVMYFKQLPMATQYKWINIKSLSTSTVEFIKQKMIELPDLDWHVQGLLLEIGKDNLNTIMDVFNGRIEKDENIKKQGERQFGIENYKVIPYHFNPALSGYIAKHREYKKCAIDLVDKMTKDGSLYNWNVINFLQRIGSPLNEIIMSIIKKGDETNLIRAIRIMYSFEGCDFDLCIEIVKRSDNKNILDRVSGIMYSTGMVAGEYGLANAFEGKAKSLVKYKKEKNPQVKKFVNKMIDNFQKSAKSERQRADEENQLRKIEFEG
ncbi:hypothetical protein ACFL1R_00890, partial [Candidatus Latescibacterota bacterium]